VCRRELPVVDAVSNDYLDEVAFVAIAGRGELGKTTEVATGLFSENLSWGLDDSVWDLYGVRGQPTSLLVDQGVVVDFWFGAIGDAAIRERFDNALGANA